MAEFKVPGTPPKDGEDEPTVLARANLDPKVRTRVDRFRMQIDAASKKHGVPAAIIESLIQQESGGNPDARNPSGATGLTQIMPGTARDLGVDPRDPDQAIEGAAAYLARNYKQFGRWDHAIAAYHAGPGNVAKAGGIPDTNDGIIDTRQYVLDILGRTRLESALGAQHDLERRLNLAQETTKTMPAPDEAARIRTAAQQRGVSFPLALADPEAVSGPVEFTWDRFASNGPLTDILLDPEKSVLAHDEAHRLAEMGGLAEEPLPESRFFKETHAGSLEVKRSLLYAKKGFNGGVLSPEDQADLTRADTRLGLLPEAEGLAENVAAGIARQAPRMARMAGVAIAGGLGAAAVGTAAGPGGAAAFGAVGAAAAVAADNGAQAYGEVYEELTEQVGVGHAVAHPASLLGALVITGLDTVSFGVLSKIPAFSILAKIPAFKKLTKDNIRPALRLALKDARFTKLLGDLALDAGTEGVTEPAQEMVQILTDYASAAVEGGDHRLPSTSEAADRMLVAALVGGAAGGVYGGVGTIARETMLRVNAGEKGNEYIDRLYEVTDKLKTAERAPEVLKEYTDKTAKSGPVQTVTVPVENLVALAQSATTPEQKAFFTRPDIARRVQEAQASGARVSMSLGDFVAYVRPLDEGKSLAQEIGLNDGMSVREAKDLSPAIKKARKEMADIGKRKEQIENEPTSLITRDLEPQLLKAGMTPEGARLQSDLVAGGVETLARRAGKDPFEVYRNARIRVTPITHEQAGSKSLEQADPKGVNARQRPGSTYTVYAHPEAPLKLKVYEDDVGGETVRVVGLLDLGVPETRENIKSVGGQGYSTALYLKALADAQRDGLGFASDVTRTDATERMYARLQRIGIPFEIIESDRGLGGDVYYISEDALLAVDLDAAWMKLTSPSPDNDAFTGFNPAEIDAAVAGLQELQHKQMGEVRGRITFDPSKRDFFAITLTGKANLSTFLHESAHYLLELMRKLDDEAGPGSPFADDLRALEEWAGVKPGEEWSVEALEKFARGMETYFGEGKPPSAKLREAFATFKRWILHTYRTLLGLNAPLTDEVRSVMDRMLATEDEIDARKLELGYFPNEIVASDTDMAPEQQEFYRRQYERGAEQAQVKLERQAIEALKHEKTAEFKRVSEAVEAKLDTHPAIAMREWFASGKRIDGGLVIPELGGKKLDPEAVKALGLAAGVTPRLKDFIAPKGTEESLTIDPAELAPYFGFKNATEMLTSLAGTPSRATLKSQMVKEEMTKLYPAYGPDPSWVEQSALEALHEEDAISNAIEVEMATTYRKAGLQPPVSPAQVARLAAKENVFEMTREELDARVYREAEARAHRAWQKAMAAKDFKLAAEETRKRLYARAMWLEVSTAAKRMDSARDYAERYTREPTQARLGKSSDQVLSTGETLGPVLRDAAIALVANVGLTKRAPPQSFAALVSKIRGLGLPVLIDPNLESAAPRAWETLSYADALAVRDALKNISKIATALSTYMQGEKEMKLDDLATATEEGLAKIKLLGRLDRKGEENNTARKYRTAILGPEHILLDLDGGEIGQVHRMWMGSAEEGQYEAERRHITRRDDLRALSDKYRPKDWAKRMSQKHAFTEGDGHEYTGREVFAMLQNFGTSSNRKKLVGGMQRAAGRTGWSEQAVLSFIHRVFPDREAYLFAQAHFDYISSASLWEDSARVMEAIYGVRPEKVEAVAIPLPDGSKIAGGYYPIIRNSNIPLKEMEATSKSALDAMDVNPLDTMYAAHGFTEKRTKAEFPLLLDPAGLAGHLYEVDHFIANAQGVLDRHKFLSRPRVRTAITHSLGIEAYRELKASNNFIASGGQLLSRELLQVKGFFDKAIMHNAILTMGGNILSGVNQVVTGVPSALTHLGPRGALTFAKALTEFVRSPFQMWKDIATRSGEVAGMNFHYDKDLRILLTREVSGEGRWNYVKSHAATTLMSPVVFGQKLVNIVTFRAAEILAQEQGHTGAEAVARANSAVRLSQSSSAEKDIASVQRSDDLWVRMLMSLASYTVALNNLVMPKRLTTREVAGSVSRILMLTMTTMMAKALMDMLLPVLEEKDAERRKGLEKWAEDSEIPGAVYAMESMLDMIGTVPLAGRTVQSVLSERQPRYVSWAETVARMPNSVIKLLDDQGYTKNDVKTITDTVGLVTGIPTRHVFFGVGEAAHEVSNGNIDDGAWRWFQELALVRPGQKGE
jgi:hypothetical protein